MPKKQLPFGLHIRDPVRITSPQVSGPKLGFVVEPCKWDDGVLVWIPNDARDKGSLYICVSDREGDSITKIAKGLDATADNE